MHVTCYSLNLALWHKLLGEHVLTRRIGVYPAPYSWKLIKGPRGDTNAAMITLLLATNCHVDWPHRMGNTI